MPKHANQHSILPDEILKPHLQYAFDIGLNDKEFLNYMEDKFDHDTYSLSVRTIRRRRKAWGLDHARTMKKKITPEQLGVAIREIRERFPKMGARDMRNRIRAEYGWWLPRDMLLEWFQVHEPDLIRERKVKQFKRKRFYAAGVNHIWALDQHDKWRRFGLFLHLCVEPYSGKIMWLKIWWTNSNPRLICGYYLSAVRALGAIPLLTQSDPGSENYGVANAQTALRHRLDPELQGTMQHKFKRKHNNIKPEIEWSKLRRRWSPGFEDKLDYGLNNEIFDPDDELEVFVLRWVVIPYLQKELDVYVAIHNHSNRRHDAHKVLPNGIPDLIFNEPAKYGSSLDFKVLVPEVAIAEVEQRWAPPDHEVFELVPQQFDGLAMHLWTVLGSPAISTETMWTVFGQLVDAFRGVTPNPWHDMVLSTIHQSGYNGGDDDHIGLMPGLQPVDIHAGLKVPMGSVEVTDSRQALTHADSTSGLDPTLGRGQGVPDEVWGDDDERIFVTFSDEGEESEGPLMSGSDSEGEIESVI